MRRALQIGCYLALAALFALLGFLILNWRALALYYVLKRWFIH